MAGADHRRHRSLPLRADRAPPWRTGRSSAAARTAARIAPLRLRPARARRPPSSSAMPAMRQRLLDPPLAIAPPGQRPRLGQRKGAIVDIAQPHQPVRQRLEVGLAVAAPAALAQLAPQIGNQFGPARREAADIVQRQLVQLRGVERRARLARAVGRPWPCLCHSPPPSGKKARARAGPPAAARRDHGPTDRICRVLDRNDRIDSQPCAPKAIRRRSTACRAASPISRRWAKRWIMPREGNRGMNFHDARGTLVRAYPYSELREDALAHARRFVAHGPQARATGWRWSPRPVRNSPPASSARSMPACGRCRCRCRPASAGATPMSTSWSSC